MGDKCSRILPVCLLSRIRTRSLRMCWSTGFKYWSSVEDILDFTYRHVINTIGGHGILLWFLDQRSLLYQHTVRPETETTDGERSSEKKKLVITFLLATLGFLIGYVPGVAFHIVVAFQTNANIDINLYSHLQNAFHFMFSCSLCLNPLIYAFRSAHFREGFKRVLTTCWKLTPQDDDIHWFRYSFLFKSQCEVEEKLRSENFGATQTIGFDNADYNIQMMPIFLLVPVLNCALLFLDDPRSLDKTIGSSDFIIRSRDKYIQRTSSFMYIKA